MKNDFCDSKVLTNESSVETFFVNRLLEALGFQDVQIKSKESISEVLISQGRKKVNYKPDYIILDQRVPLLVVDAKSPKEDIYDWVDQCSSYCFEINKRRDDQPVKYFAITNGTRFALFDWDSVSKPIAELAFSDFKQGNKKYEELKSFISAKELKATPTRVAKPKKTKGDEQLHEFRIASLEEVNQVFAWCHQKIYQKDNLSQASAFMEFVKLMFLKLLSDKAIHSEFAKEIAGKSKYSVPITKVKFSTYWIDQAKQLTSNPVAKILFTDLCANLENQIFQNQKKRMFDKNEDLVLNAETIRIVVGKLESIDLYSIDSDLNGRLFETFLGATMRGKDLGQYFTPRSVVKLMLGLTGIQFESAAQSSIPTIIDPCCGSGGFLIEALWKMWSIVDANRSISSSQKNSLKKTIAHERIIGMDIGRSPSIARVARINMYLHGDGGSRIYQVDALSKSLPTTGTGDPEKDNEYKELNSLYSNTNGFADVIITNPPFSKTYESKHPTEKAILLSYEIAKTGRNQTKDSIKTNVLFIERYYDLLKPGGRVVAIVDDSILGADGHRYVRDYIRSKFLILGIISLPGDAFQRSNARVKTSIMILQKKQSSEEENPPLYMNFCTAVGIDDAPRQRTLPIDRINRKKANEEIREITESFSKHLSGIPQPKFIVSQDRILDRLDVKSCLLSINRKEGAWKASGFDIHELRDVVSVYDENNLEDDDVLETETSQDEVSLLRVTYKGETLPTDRIIAGECNTKTLIRVHKNDIIISNINAVNGAIGVVGASADGCYVTNEFTICRAKDGYDAYKIWMILRSPEIRSDMLILASGMGRTRVRWENIRTLKIPYVHTNRKCTKALQEIRNSEALFTEAEAKQAKAEEVIIRELCLSSKDAENILTAFKPPK